MSERRVWEIPFVSAATNSKTRLRAHLLNHPAGRGRKSSPSPALLNQIAAMNPFGEIDVKHLASLAGLCKSAPRDRQSLTLANKSL